MPRIDAPTGSLAAQRITSYADALGVFQQPAWGGSQTECSFSPRLGTRNPRQHHTVRSCAGAAGTDPRMRRAGIRNVACPCGKVPAEPIAGSRILIGEGSSTGRCGRACPATAIADPCRLQDMPPAHEHSGDRHYPCEVWPAIGKNGEKGEHRVRAAGKSSRRPATAVPPDTSAHPPRTYRCRDAGNRAMNVRGARYREYQAAERTPGGRKGRTASQIRGISVCCVTFRAAWGQLAAPRITPDNCRYRERTCQSAFA